VALPPVKRYAVHLRWRSRTMGVFSWRIDAIAKNSAALVAGLMNHFGPGCMVSVKAVKP
jgi:hypothetical protein